MESIIKWHTGEPKEEGKYLVTMRARHNIVVAHLYYDYLNGWSEWNDVLAWCKLSDIEPYKEETE